MAHWLFGKAAMVARACEDLEPLRVAIEKAREASEGLSNFTNKVGDKMKISMALSRLYQFHTIVGVHWGLTIWKNHLVIDVTAKSDGWGLRQGQLGIWTVKALVKLGYPVRLQKLVCAKAKNLTNGLKWLRTILLSFKRPSIHINSALSNYHPIVTWIWHHWPVRSWHPRQRGQVQLDTNEIDKATLILHDLEVGLVTVQIEQIKSCKMSGDHVCQKGMGRNLQNTISFIENKHSCSTIPAGFRWIFPFTD